MVGAIAAACFVAGIALDELARRGSVAPAAPDAARTAEPAASPSDAADAGTPRTAPAPRILFDPSSIELLPDASLRLALPPAFDGGAR